MTQSKRRLIRARERRVIRKITEKYGPITYKRNLIMEEILCIGCGATIQTTRQGLVLDLLPSRHSKRFGDWQSLLPTLFPSRHIMKSRMSS